MSAPTRKYLICEYVNGLGDRHFTAACRQSFLGIGYWSLLKMYSMGEAYGSRRFASFEEAANQCAAVSRAFAAESDTLVNRTVIER